jgi:hypothetical protein
VSKKRRETIPDPEYGVDSRYESREEAEAEAKLLMEARSTTLKNLSKDQIDLAKQVQSKLKLKL